MRSWGLVGDRWGDTEAMLGPVGFRVTLEVCWGHVGYWDHDRRLDHAGICE